MANAIIDDKKEVIEVVKIIYKRPEYLNIALRKHYNKKKEEDPEYLEKEKERVKKYRDENRDHVNELARIRRQKKKAEAKAKQEEDAKKQSAKAEADLPALETLAV